MLTPQGADMMGNTDPDRRRSTTGQKKGTTPSFDMLMNRYQPMITGFLRSRTASTQLAEDISQEVWLKAWQHWEKFDHTKGTEASYLLAIARHETINYWRRTQGKEPLPYETVDPEHSQLQLLSAEICLLDELEEKESRKWYRQLLITLLTEGGYPHQVLAFLYSRVIHCSEDTADRVSGYPAKTAEQQGSLPLGRLHHQAGSHYSQKSTLTTQQVHACFQELNPALETTLETLFQKAGDTVSATWAAANGMSHTPSKNTRLQDYAREYHLEKAIADWCYKVARRLKKKLIHTNNLTHGEGE